MNYAWPSDTQVLHVGDLRIDLRSRSLVFAEGRIELQQRVFELLLLLLSEQNKLLTRAELFERLWPGLVVSDASLSQSIWLLRRALGGSRRDWIRTIANRGYVFQSLGEVAWLRSMPTAAEDGGIRSPQQRPSAAVGSSRGLILDTESTPPATDAVGSDVKPVCQPQDLLRKRSWLFRAIAAVAAMLWRSRGGSLMRYDQGLPSGLKARRRETRK